MSKYEVFFLIVPLHPPMTTIKQNKDNRRTNKKPLTTGYEFHNFSTTFFNFLIFHDFPCMDFVSLKFSDFPQCP